MATAPRCPVCHRLYHSTTPIKASTVLTCNTCQEEFAAPESVDAAPKPAQAKPVEPRTKKPRGEREESEQPRRSEPRRARRERQREGSSSSRTWIVVILMGACVAAFLLVGLIGTAIWFTSKKREAEAQAELAELDAERARQEKRGPLHLAIEAQEKARRDHDNEIGNPGFAEGVLPVPINPRPEPDPVLPPNLAIPSKPVSPPDRPVLNPNPYDLPKPQPVPEPGGVPAVAEPANPIKAGAQTKLRELTSVSLPELPPPPKNERPDPSSSSLEYIRIIHCPKHELLFALSPKSVWIYDLKEKKALGTQDAKEKFTDMSLSPDQSVLFVADYGGTRTGYGDPINPSRVHRFDMKTRKWEERKAPKIAYKIEAVDKFRVLLLEQDQHVNVTLNKWEEDSVKIRELARINSDYHGDIEYDPRTGRIYHGNSGSSSKQITVNVVDGNKLKSAGNTGTDGTADKSGGGPVTLSQDGSRFYYGRLQVKASKPTENLEVFPEVIVAASRDIAFGAKAYYRATTGEKLGEFAFKTVKEDPSRPWDVPMAVISVSTDGKSVWVLDRDKNVARQFSLEGEK